MANTDWRTTRNSITRWFTVDDESGDVIDEHESKREAIEAAEIRAGHKPGRRIPVQPTRVESRTYVLHSSQMHSMFFSWVESEVDEGPDTPLTGE